MGKDMKSLAAFVLLILVFGLTLYGFQIQNAQKPELEPEPHQRARVGRLQPRLMVKVPKQPPQRDVESYTGTVASKAPQCRKDPKYLERYKASLKAGVALIIGANVGPTQTDPAWGTLVTTNFTKVFLEPIPPLFSRLAANLAKIEENSNYVAINAAINVDIATTKSGDVPTLRMYCIGEPGEVVMLRGKVVKWMSQVCTTVRARLFHKYDTLQHADAAEVEEKITEFTVPMLTFDQLVATARVSLESVTYVQIDVEGIDDKVVCALPLHNPLFRPRTIIWEHVLFNDTESASVNGFLEAHGYEVCVDWQNIVAFDTRERTHIEKIDTNSVKVVAKHDEYRSL